MNRIYISKVYDPFFNLAAENLFFSDTGSHDRILYLWRNEDVVVIGRYQNPWRECNIDKMDADGVHLMRRGSGGGAVFQDIYNICFTFVGDREAVSKEQNSKIICDALESLGVHAEASGRNDILAGGFKVSGAAYKESEGKFLHHGTLLVNTDLGRLGMYLCPDERKLRSKGIASVRSRVANLKDIVPDITVDRVMQAVCDSFMTAAGETAGPEYIGYDALERNEGLRTEYEKLKSWEWRFGTSPEFTHCIDERFEWGGVEIQLNVKKAVIDSVIVYSDALDTDFVEEVKRTLTGLKYDTAVMKTALSRRALAVAAVRPSAASALEDVSGIL